MAGINVSDIFRNTKPEKQIQKRIVHYPVIEVDENGAYHFDYTQTACGKTNVSLESFATDGECEIEIIECKECNKHKLINLAEPVSKALRSLIEIVN